MGNRRSLLLRVLIVVFGFVALGRSGHAERTLSKEKENASVAFRVLPAGAKGSKANVTAYVGIRNIDKRLVRLLLGGVPLVWGYSEPLPSAPPAELPVSGSQVRLPDLKSVVFSSSGPPTPGSYCPGTGQLAVALEKGNEILVETAIDLSGVGDGVHTIILNLEMMTVAGEGGCGPTESQRGKAQMKVQIRGTVASFPPS